MDFPLPGEGRQTCKICGKQDKFDFHVPDQEWCRIVPPRHRTHAICLACFDTLAYQAGVNYTLATLYFAGDQGAFTFRRV